MAWGQPQQHRYAVLCGVFRVAAPSFPPTLRLWPHCLVALRRMVAVHLADRGVQVDSDCPSPGPAQAAHALARVVSVSRSSRRTCPKVKAHKKVPGAEGAMTRWPSTLVVSAAQQVGVVDAVLTRQHRVDQGQQLASGVGRAGPLAPGRSAGRRWAGCRAARPGWRPAAGRRWRGCRRSRCRAGPGCGRIPSRNCPPDVEQGGCGRRHFPGQRVFLRTGRGDHHASLVTSGLRLNV
jgi:hypothetical protein